MIALFILLILGFFLIIQSLNHREQYISISEVIPQGTILSREDGIIEHHGVCYIVGTDDLLRKKHLLESLNLLNLEDSVIVDLRFRSQVIIKNVKQGSRFNNVESDPRSNQLRRR
ncbi:MAG: hypothetical protein JSV97_00930 [candidate division WOR-3 bacterium]|nr:MAG: hypothetical protein JSV97_00930 [candidate division WOR-3 bacterium]